MVWTSSGTGDGSFTNDEICGCRGVTLAFDCLLSFSGTAPDEFPKSMWIDERWEVQIVKALETSKSSTPRADKAKPGGNSTMNMKDSLLQPVPPSRVHYCCHLRGVECLKETSECRCPLTYPLCSWRDRQAIFVKPTRTGRVTGNNKMHTALSLSAIQLRCSCRISHVPRSLSLRPSSRFTNNFKPRLFKCGLNVWWSPRRPGRWVDVCGFVLLTLDGTLHVTAQVSSNQVASRAV